MKHKTSELTGALLDAAVAKADGAEHPHSVMTRGEDGALRPFEPSSTWNDGGPIIEREGIRTAPVFFDDLVEFAPFTVDYWEAVDTRRGRRHQGSTPLIAAMRAFVTAKLGDEVEL